MRLLKVFKTKNPSIMEDYINGISEKIQILDIQYSSSTEKRSWKFEDMETLYVAFITYVPQYFYENFRRLYPSGSTSIWYELIKWIDIDGITHYPLKEELEPHD